MYEYRGRGEEKDVLRHGLRYYWRVRGRSADGVWGEWSDTWSFVAAGPRAPRDLKGDYDGATGKTTLTWQPPAEGTPVSHYEIYAAGGLGFSPLREPEQATILGHPVERPATLIDITADTNWDASLRTEVFWRIVAVDGDGKITSGAWHEIQIAPNDLARIEANIVTQLFIQSRGGGNY